MRSRCVCTSLAKLVHAGPVCVCVCVTVLTLFSCVDFHIICNMLITLRMNISARGDVT